MVHLTGNHIKKIKILNKCFLNATNEEGNVLAET